MARDQFADPGGEGPRRRRADLQPEAAQHPAQAHLDVMVLGLQQLARRQQRSHFLRRQRLAVHRAEPAEPHQLGNAARVLAVGLDRHRLVGVPHVPGPEQFDRQSRFPHARIQPLRQRSSLQPDPPHRKPQRAEPAGQDLGLARHLGLADDPPGRVDNAQARAFQ